MTSTAEFDNLITLPRGQAAVLAGISRHRLSYWEMRSLVRPAIRHRVSARNIVQLYTFDDLICLLIIVQLRRRGSSLQHVRRVVDHLRSRGYAAPLIELQFATHGRSEIYFRHDDGSWEGDARPDQLVIRQVINLEPIRQLIRNAAQRPGDAGGRATRRRGARASRPMFDGTRLPVSTVVSWLREGYTADDLLEAYPELTVADIDLARAHTKGG